MAQYFRRTSLWFRLAKDGVACVLLSPLTGLKFTMNEPKEGFHLSIPNILTVGQVAGRVMMFVTLINNVC